MRCCIAMLGHGGYALPLPGVYCRQDEKAETWISCHQRAYCSGIPLEYNAESSSPSAQRLSGQYGLEITGYNVVLLRSTNF